MYLREIQGIGLNLYVAGSKGFSAPRPVRCREKGGIKNAGIPHDVIENKYIKNFSLMICHDIYENN
jgi:hypothetical protein